MWTPNEFGSSAIKKVPTEKCQISIQMRLRGRAGPDAGVIATARYLPIDQSGSMLG